MGLVCQTTILLCALVVDDAMRKFSIDHPQGVPEKRYKSEIRISYWRRWRDRTEPGPHCPWALKGPYWGKYISKFSMNSRKLWGMLAKTGGERSMDDFVSPWTLQPVRSRMITWQKVRVVSWWLVKGKFKLPSLSFFCWYLIPKQGRCGPRSHPSCYLLLPLFNLNYTFFWVTLYISQDSSSSQVPRPTCWWKFLKSGRDLV